ncbi:MAG TPA: tRNA (guanine(26)-N(2))-dimethyltransferase [Candidatus Nanoarchaeia archaeon]|nr:tRNA (guanine(26)-N(2))-dimethyltransferase [Candidatus Nanoarchaeia archaeon]
MRNTKTVQVREGSIKLIIPDPKKYKLDAKAPVFYNPDMRLNRDISILLLKSASPKPQSAVDLLAATGVRGLRIKKEAGIKRVYINDASPTAFGFIKRNAALNKLSVKVSNLRAHEFLATRYKFEDPKFGYVDIDPFGTPVPFLDAGVKATVENRRGIIAVTATDTSALCGTYPEACKRKYGSWPLYNYLMNEIGLRILVKKVQEVGAQYDIALTPIFAHTTRHYMRAYLRAERGADKTDEVLKSIGMFQDAGPMWLCPLYDIKLVEKMRGESLKDKNISEETRHLLYTISQEAPITEIGFYDLAEMKLKQVPKITDVIGKLQVKGFAAARTHFSDTGIKTNANDKEFKKILKEV